MLALSGRNCNADVCFGRFLEIDDGSEFAPASDMGVSRLEDLRAWQTAWAFKLEAYRVVRESPLAQADLRFKHQLLDAAASGESNVAEGFRRFRPADFSHFLDYAVASFQEALNSAAGCGRSALLHRRPSTR